MSAAWLEAVGLELDSSCLSFRGKVAERSLIRNRRSRPLGCGVCCAVGRTISLVTDCGVYGLFGESEVQGAGFLAWVGSKYCVWLGGPRAVGGMCSVNF